MLHRHPCLLLSAFALATACLPAQLQLLHDFATGTEPAFCYACPWHLGNLAIVPTIRGLMVTDGTAAGTTYVREMPDPTPIVDPTGAPSYRVMVRANDLLVVAGYPSALWRTDGTFAGTNLVTMLGEDTTYWSSVPPTRVSALLGNVGVFVLHSANEGLELWRTDGTAGGTFLLRDIAPGTASSEPNDLTTFQGKVYFSADDGVHGRELWATDGTIPGTVLVQDIEPVGGSDPGELCAFGGALYFAATTAITGRELFRTDGTAAGTQLVVDLVPSAAGASPTGLTAAATGLWFTASTPATGVEPWLTDGTAAGTHLVTDLLPGALPSYPADYLAVGPLVYFTAEPNGNRTVWRSDGTVAGTWAVDPNLVVYGYGRPTLAAAAGTVFFLASDGVLQFGLFATNGTSATFLGAVGASSLTSIGAFVLAYPPITRSDGTAGGTYDLGATAASSDAQAFSLPLGHAYIPDGLGTLWITDGTPAGLTQMPGPVLGRGAPMPDGKSVVGPGFDLTLGAGFAFTDGTAAGTHFLDIGYLIGAGQFTPLPNGAFCLVADNSFDFGEPWFTDGTYAGTHQIIDLMPGPAAGCSLYQEPVLLGARVLFFGDDGAHGNEPWITDGTAAGTTMLEVQPGAGSSIPDLEAVWPKMTLFAGRAWFAADDGVHGIELWSTDGTSAGTTMLVDLVPGAAGSRPQLGAATNSRLFFTATTATSGTEVWSTDGTAAGTQLVLDIAPGAASANPSNLTAGRELCFFTAFEPITGAEWWRSDGTAAGTFQLADAAPGPESGAGWPVHLFADRDVLVFSARTPQHGTEPWISDGTVAGTHELVDLVPGVQGSSPLLGVVAGTNLVMTAWTPTTGNELFAADIQLLTAGLGISLPIGTGCRGSRPPPRLRTVGSPAINDASFGFAFSGTLPYVPMLFAADTTRLEVPLGNGCWLHQFPAATAVALTDANGAATLPLPVPNTPALVGAEIDFQGVALDPLGGFAGLTFSNGLRTLLGSH